MTVPRYNIGIIGYGLSAKIFHIPFITAVSEFDLYAVVQRHPTPENDARKDLEGVKVYHTVPDLLEDREVDVVVVTTTPETHLELAKQVLEAGKHVVVEKPFTPTSAEASRLVDLARERSCLLTVYQNRRWDADFLTLSACIARGTLGRIVEFESHFDRYRPEMPAKSSWKSRNLPGGGVVYDLGTHLIDQIVHLFGMPQKITAFIGSQREHNESGPEDSCTILLHYKGMLATIKAGVISPEVKQLRYWVRGDKGSFKKYYLDCQEEQLKTGLRPGDAGYGVEPVGRHGVLNTVEDGEIKSRTLSTVEPATYAEFYRKLAEALSGQSHAIPVDPAGAASVIRLIELAKESSRQGKTLDV